MDLNGLLFHHQVAIIARGERETRDPQAPSFDLVQHYQARLDHLRQQLGVTAYPNTQVTAHLAG